jgi:hypothetical protein
MLFYQLDVCAHNLKWSKSSLPKFYTWRDIIFKAAYPAHPDLHTSALLSFFQSIQRPSFHILMPKEPSQEAQNLTGGHFDLVQPVAGPDPATQLMIAQKIHQHYKDLPTSFKKSQFLAKGLVIPYLCITLSLTTLQGTSTP